MRCNALLGGVNPTGLHTGQRLLAGGLSVELDTPRPPQSLRRHPLLI